MRRATGSACARSWRSWIGIKRLCLYGEEDENSACSQFADMGVIAEKMPGDHHFDEDYQGVAQRILAHLPALPAKP